ncbi:helix-turn-helix transcriptional regulator [Clostridioides sp. ZZV14-6154]|uniref:helix-turn-helix transcriptional regulator n=1 Tax=unclassified Clostridioides TaxID=2635829 RepID=UPI001D1221D2|nr:helix-turn-helix transcriptional regulator [Clostridioides sp. ZZV14-6150]MCC0660517.1 helix-turn-helix transcriptional regulator [Clostridioides sp. ZZV14-6154]MCC0669603.1 helix-turn-helix transcriptional regulator [Clostridioides sp. ZZV14-6153]MCC0726618.1 helix-turn-helix transcriptional regulator [Clostridioides sp. ZZV14-6045]MCC0730554.1 helix-turn-helix transcriptional regulator [Clostridioides sp. ZZV14-6048]MCC0739242.1 helix-turn-helix transcriptional regulator [Clostridioides s
MYEWQQQIQIIIDEIDKCIKNYNGEVLTLRFLSRKLGYSEFYTTKKFKEISGIQFRDYLRNRKLAFALKEVRDSDKSLLDIAFDYGFSSHEAFTRAFKGTYGVTPSEYRKNPKPVVLRTKITPFDRYFLGLGEIGMIKSTDGVKIYFATIPAHKFLYIKNNESNGYWDFWRKQSLIPGQDHETICGLLDSIKGKLDDDGGSEANCGSGQIMAYMNDSDGRLCDWGILRTECWGVRLPFDYKGELPPQMLMIDIPEAEYIIFEHGPFNYEQENCSVEEKIETAMATFDYTGKGYCPDITPGRIMYFYYDPEQYFKYIRPVKKM